MDSEPTTEKIENAPAGRVAAVHGVVLDVDFPANHLPAIGHALRIARATLPPLIIEVHAHLSAVTVRCIALASPTGIHRGLEVSNTAKPVMIPVGDATLGRIFNVLGEPIDGGAPFPDGERRSIYSAPPPLTEQEAVASPFVTGIKAFDLLLPLPRGGKIGLFGGAGVGKTVLTGVAALDCPLENLEHAISEESQQLAALEREAEKHFDRVYRQMAHTFNHHRRRYS